MKKIILASASPRRKMLMESAEIQFEIMVSDSDESYDEGISPTDVALHIAKNKNNVVFDKLKEIDQIENAIIVSADTIVVLNNQIIGKPKDREHAIEILKKISGQRHAVITAVVLKSNEKEVAFSDTTYVTFYELTDQQIEIYVDRFKPFDKAGSYAIQEWIGIIGVKSIEGDFYNVMGLPISRVLRLLNTAFN